MESDISKIFELYWALMPLSTEEMSKIPVSHRIRPYLICMDHDNYCYGFPCTSNVYGDKNRYTNSRVYLGRYTGDTQTLLKLEQIYKLPEENLRGFFGYLSKEKENEIIKKIQANTAFSNYPKDVVEYFKSFSTSISCNDVVISNNQLYNVVGLINRKLVLVPIYKYPVDNSVECHTDGLIYYADVDNLVFMQNDNSFTYCTQLFGLDYGDYIKDKDSMETLAEYYYKLPRFKCTCDYSKLYMLEPGMIIDYLKDDMIFKMIILNKDANHIEVITGNENEMYSNFKYEKLPIDTDMCFEITGTLIKDRLDKLRNKLIQEQGSNNNRLTMKI